MIDYLNIMYWIEQVMTIIGGALVCLFALVAFNLLAYLQVTWNMTPEEKARFDKYIEENGLRPDPDDFY